MKLWPERFKCLRSHIISVGENSNQIIFYLTKHSDLGRERDIWWFLNSETLLIESKWRSQFLPSSTYVLSPSNSHVLHFPLSLLCPPILAIPLTFLNVFLKYRYSISAWGYLITRYVAKPSLFVLFVFHFCYLLVLDIYNAKLSFEIHFHPVIKLASLNHLILSLGISPPSFLPPPPLLVMEGMNSCILDNPLQLIYIFIPNSAFGFSSECLRQQ